MTLCPRVLRFTLLALAIACAAAATARADGLPVLGIDVGPTGIATPDGNSRYVTVPAGARTVVARVAQDGGRVLASRSLAGNFTIPAVAYDGTARDPRGEPRRSFRVHALRPAGRHAVLRHRRRVLLERETGTKRIGRPDALAISSTASAKVSNRGPVSSYSWPPRPSSIAPTATP